ASQGMENFTGAYGSFTPGRNGGAWSATNSAWRYYPQSSLNTDYTVFWTPNATLVGDSTQAPFATPLATTDYIVDIKRNDNSCNYKDTVTVNVIPHFSYNFANDTSICSGQSVQLNVTGNATNIAWTPNDGTINDTTIFNPTITPDSSSAYYALLDSAGYCPTLDTVNILFIEQVIVDTTIVTNPPCNGAASIEIILDTASSPAQFSIDGGITFTSDSFFNNLAPGVYDIVVGGGGSCDTSYQITINATAPSIIIDSIITTDLSCNNSSDGTITVYAQGGSGTLTYSVDSGVTYQAGNQFNNLDSGYYNIFVQDGLLCTTDSFATLNAPNAINISLVSNDSLDCYGNTDGIIGVTASGGAGGYTYSIDNIIFGTDTFFTNLSQGTYTVYVQDANMCIDSLQNILIRIDDSLFITNITVQNVACFGDTDGSLISFDAQGGTAPYQYATDGTCLAQKQCISKT
ncbi:MAG: SprB repeat-containing protein, partial [Chitinophagales bacterium]